MISGEKKHLSHPEDHKLIKRWTSSFLNPEWKPFLSSDDDFSNNSSENRKIS